MLWLLSCSSTLAQLQTIVVLPFANQSKDAGLQWMGESFAEGLEDRLKWPKLNARWDATNGCWHSTVLAFPIPAVCRSFD
jgi:hypothetical protein